MTDQNGSFFYFAYGSNLWASQIRLRCPSARPVGRGRLVGWQAVYDKPSFDGSAKLNIHPRTDGFVDGLIYEIHQNQRPALDSAEPGYTAIEIELEAESGESTTALTYTWTNTPTTADPYEWYTSIVLHGATIAGLDDTYIQDCLNVSSTPDPLAPCLRVATERDLPAMRAVLSAAISSPGPRYSAHPGDLNWWFFHPNHIPDIATKWTQPGRGVLVLDEVDNEINVFVAPGESPLGLIEWAQRRLGGHAELGWVDDDDEELVSYLLGEGYEIVHTERNYEWHLSADQLPTPVIPDGWTLRHVVGESEADSRREASHAAFESKMKPSAHLDRYLKFMRSPSYEPTRDLVAIAPDGSVGAFMIWWPDQTGIAQIEPFGTHPKFHRQGIGRALMYFGLKQMSKAGMRVVRVGTDEPRDANAFYEGVGFEDDGRIRWWKK